LLETVAEGRLFALDRQMLISIGIQLFNISILAAALSFILYKPVSDFIRRRADRIREQMVRARDDVARAGELKAHYEEKLKDIELERAEILKSARRIAAEKSGQILDEAKKEAAAVRERAAAYLQTERERVNKEMKLHVIEVSSLMAEKFVTRAIDGDTQDRLFAEAMAELEDTAWLS